MIPHRWVRSPMRYPGGKDRLKAFLVSRMLPLPASVTSYVEPFVGGGSTLIAMSLSCPHIKKFIANDRDHGVGCLWRCIADNRLSRRLAGRIARVSPTPELHAQCEEMLDSTDPLDAAFACLVRNRMSYDGILTSGVLGGCGQNGKYRAGCRYNAKELSRRITALHSHFNGRLLVRNQDWSDVVVQYDKPSVQMFLDPPYWEHGNELYRVQFTLLDHCRLAWRLHHTRCRWLLTYDEHPAIRRLYGSATIERIGVKQEADAQGHPVATKWELVIRSTSTPNS